VAADFAGTVPDGRAELESLPGVGAYTAAPYCQHRVRASRGAGGRERRTGGDAALRADGESAHGGQEEAGVGTRGEVRGLRAPGGRESGADGTGRDGVRARWAEVSAVSGARGLRSAGAGRAGAVSELPARKACAKSSGPRWWRRMRTAPGSGSCRRRAGDGKGCCCRRWFRRARRTRRPLLAEAGGVTDRGTSARSPTRMMVSLHGGDVASRKRRSGCPSKTFPSARAEDHAVALQQRGWRFAHPRRATMSTGR